MGLGFTFLLLALSDQKEDGISKQEVLEVYNQYGYLMHNRCQYILKDSSLAEDAFQQTFIRLVRYGQSYKKAPSKLFWLFRACNQVCFNMLKQRQRMLYIEGFEFKEEINCSGNKSSETTYTLRDAVIRFLHKLNLREREIAVFAFVDGMTQEEIAKETGWSRVTINKKLKAIRKVAESNLEKAYA